MITLDANPGLEGLATYYPGLVYSHAAGQTLTMDLMIPNCPETDADRRFPLILFVQGSGWTDNSPFIGAQIPQLSMFAQQGYVIASVRHRSRRDGFAAPAFLQDCKSALRFLRTNAAAYHIDPDHVCAWGTSSGGNTVLLMGLTGDDPAYRTDEYPDASDAVQAVIDCFGPTDLPELIATLNFDETAETFCNEMFGGSLETHLELAKAMSPYYQVKDGVTYPPFLIGHGTADELVPYAQSKQMIARLEEAQCDVTAIAVEGAPHEGSFWSQEFYAYCSAFLMEHGF